LSGEDTAARASDGVQEKRSVDNEGSEGLANNSPPVESSAEPGWPDVTTKITETKWQPVSMESLGLEQQTEELTDGVPLVDTADISVPTEVTTISNGDVQPVPIESSSPIQQTDNQPVAIGARGQKSVAEAPVSREVRQLLRTLPSAAVVLTTIDAVPQGLSEPLKYHFGGKLFRGMTVSSFTSLTLSPDPIITFNIRSPPDSPAPSATLTSMIKSQHFLVHVLDSTKDGARIADLFTKGNSSDGSIHSPFELGQRAKLFDIMSETVTFEGRGDNQIHIALPRLQGASVRAVFKCELVRRGERYQGLKETPQGAVYLPKSLIAVGDHVLVFGKVLEVLHNGSPNTDLVRGKSYGLSYAHGHYRKPARPFAKEDVSTITGVGGIKATKYDPLASKGGFVIRKIPVRSNNTPGREVALQKQEQADRVNRD